MLKIDAENQTGQTGRSGVSAAPVRAVVACGWWVPGWSVGPPAQRAGVTWTPGGQKIRENDHHDGRKCAW